MQMHNGKLSVSAIQRRAGVVIVDGDRVLMRMIRGFVRVHLPTRNAPGQQAQDQ